MSSDPDARPSPADPAPDAESAGVVEGSGGAAPVPETAATASETARVPESGGTARTGDAPRTPPAMGPRAMRKPGRTETRMKDMLGALLILIPIALLIVGVGRSCTFAPTGPTVDPGAGPTVDAPARLAEYARGSAFPLRVPDVPWRANATDRGPVEGGGTAVRVGYLTEQGRYLRLVQSDAPEEALLRTETGGGAVSAEGVTPAAGLSWVTYRTDGGEAVRIATAPGARLLVTGSGSDDEFRALAEATVRARVLPPGAAGN